jgi:hypothetical protein
MQIVEQAGQKRFVQRRPALPRRPHIVSQRGLRSQRATDLAVQIDAMRQNRLARPRSPERA